MLGPNSEHRGFPAPRPQPPLLLSPSTWALSAPPGVHLGVLSSEDTETGVCAPAPDTLARVVARVLSALYCGLQGTEC